MKTIKFASIVSFFLLLSGIVSAQSKTESFKVAGNCGMCKTRIEKAAKDAGATEASWQAENKMLTVTYESSTTTAAKIQQKIAEVGHDNNGLVAANDVYNNLPPCCKYERESDAAGVSEKKACEKDGKSCKGDDQCKDAKGKKAKKGKSCCSDTEKANCSKEGKSSGCCKKS